MKKQYFKPEIKTEVLLKEDVLIISEEKENKYIKSRSIFIDDFSVEKLLSD